MSTSQPRPAKGGAESHRQPEGANRTEDEEEDEAVLPPDVGAPDDRDGGGGGGGGQPPADAGSGSMFASLSARRLALVAAALIALYLVYRYSQSRGGMSVPIERDDPDEPSEPEFDPGRPDVEVDDNGRPVLPDDPDDPLATDHEAGKWLFNRWGTE